MERSDSHWDPFFLALTDVTRIGVLIQTPVDPGSYDYRLDNWQFLNDAGTAVPEPGAIPLVLTALASAFWTRRRYRTTST